MLNAFSLWLGTLILGAEPASALAITLFLFVGVGVACVPLMLGILLYPRGGFSSVLGGAVMTFFSFILGMTITLSPLVHAEQFISCEYREVLYRDVDVRELWCAERGSLDDEFGEMKFVGFK